MGNYAVVFNDLCVSLRKETELNELIVTALINDLYDMIMEIIGEEPIKRKRQ